MLYMDALYIQSNVSVICITSFLSLPYEIDWSYICLFSVMKNHEGQGYDSSVFPIREALKKYHLGALSLQTLLPDLLPLQHPYPNSTSFYSSLISVITMFFLPQDPYFTNLKYGWFGHFHTYFNQLLIHTISSCQDIAADSSGNICPLTRASKLFCSFVWSNIYSCCFLKFPLRSQKTFRSVSQSFPYVSRLCKCWEKLSPK